MINLKFLGTSYALPTIDRNHTAMLLTYHGENILIDCGEGTQRQFRKAKLNPCKITKILITHIHGDHVLGLPGMLQTLSLSGYNKILFVYGPSGMKKFMKNLMKTFIFDLKYKIKVEEVNGKFFENDDFYLESRRMVHGASCNAYVFSEKDKRKIDRAKLRKTKLPHSNILRKLKEGKNISYNGKKYFAKDLTFVEKGKKISFVLDTLYNSKIVPFVKNSELLICGVTFDSELKDKAKEKKHLTSEQGGIIAKKSRSKKLALTHISQRYEKDNGKLLRDAKKHFKNSLIANDFDDFEI